MSAQTTGFYRSYDSPNNFAVHIKLWKVTTGSVVPLAAGGGVGLPHEIRENLIEMKQSQRDEEETEEVIIHWQEKLFSEKEFEYYSDPMNCTTPLAKRYHEDIVKIRSAHGGRLNKRIFTYVDSDSFSDTNFPSRLTASERDSGSFLVQKLALVKLGQLRQRNIAAHLSKKRLVVEKPTEMMTTCHVLTASAKSMLIMVDVGMQSQASYIKDERVVCSIKINVNGLIEIKPDIELRDIITLETYHEARAVYQIALAHASTPIRKADKEQETQLLNELYSRHADLMCTQVGNEIVPTPLSNEMLVYVFGEIVSARNFEYDDLHVEYYLDLPTGWQSAGSHLVGVTQSCRVNGENVAFFSYPFEFQLTCRLHELEEDRFITWPTLFLQAASIDSWQRYRTEGYGFCQIPDVAGSATLEIDTWRPTGDGLRPALNRYFIGGSPELQDFMCIKGSQEFSGDKILSKFYFKTVTSGILRIRLNTVFHHAFTDQGKPSKFEMHNKRNKGFRVAAQGLAHVLDAFHTARKRMLAARATLPSAN